MDQTQAEVNAVQSLIDNHFNTEKEIVALDAGCGSVGHFCLERPYVVGIDVSEEQLDRNPGLSERILGDIQTYPLPSSSFDLVACWDVLEHVPEPEKALENLLRSLKWGGLMVVKLPNVFSIKGLVTKFTPHWFHVGFYRYILGKKDAGKGDTAPFPTYHRLSISPPALRRFARENNLTIEYLRTYAHYWQHTKKIKVVNGLVRLLGLVINAATLGKVDPTRSECIAVFRKGEAISQR